MGGKTFIVPLTELFASEDVREREYLKAILHGIYARNMRLRRLIRTQMSNCCWRVIHSERDHVENGISECLQLVCSIIQGLTTPIKQEYKNILYSVLIPLHKANQRKLSKFHETLLACCIQFILKDLSIGLDILSGLIKYWPFQSATKSDIFLKEIVIIINTMMTDIISAENEESDDDEDEETKRRRKEKNLFKFTKRGQHIASDIIDKLVECMISDNHCLAEKSLLAFGEIGQKYSSFYLIITIINGIGADLWMNHLMKHSKHLQRETVIMQKRLNQCTNMEIYENRICSKINIIQFIQTILCLLAINRECANTNNCKEWQ